MSRAAPIIGPDGTRYRSLTQAEDLTGVHRNRLVVLAETEGSGWVYEADRPPQPGRISHPAKPSRSVVDARGRRYVDALTAAVTHGLTANSVRAMCRQHKDGWHYQDDPPAKSYGGLEGMRADLYADNATGWHPRERQVWVTGGGL